MSKKSFFFGNLFNYVFTQFCCHTQVQTNQTQELHIPWFYFLLWYLNFPLTHFTELDLQCFLKPIQLSSCVSFILLSDRTLKIRYWSVSHSDESAVEMLVIQ